MSLKAIEDLRARQAEIKTRLEEIDSAAAGQRFDDDQKVEWNRLNEELTELDTDVEELEARAERIAELASKPGNIERTEPASRGRNRNRTRVPEDPTNLTEYRQLATSMDDLEQSYRDGAMAIVERMIPAHPSVSTDEARDRVSRMLDTIDVARGEDGGSRWLARRIIATSSPMYQRAWGKYISGQPRTADEERALGIGSQGGGYPVPIVLDPTVILTSNGVINPLRQISRVVQIVGNTWEGVASAGITAAYSAEATEASDNSPTLTQPTANVEKAQAFVPFSIESGEDWQALSAEMAVMFADAKDVLESNKFLSGAGHASNVPEGLLVGATAVVNTAATATFAVGDLYSLEAALPPRWRARAKFVANRTTYQKVRQMDTAGGANLWVQLQDPNPATLIGYDSYEWSDMVATPTTTGATILTIGDFNQFAIIDRVGMNVELVPHLFGSGNRYPTGQRGLYAHWRNTSKVLVAGAFKSLKVL